MKKQRLLVGVVGAAALIGMAPVAKAQLTITRLNPPMGAFNNGFAFPRVSVMNAGQALPGGGGIRSFTFGQNVVPVFNPQMVSGRNFFALNGLPTPNSTLAARLDAFNGLPNGGVFNNGVLINNTNPFANGFNNGTAFNNGFVSGNTFNSPFVFRPGVTPGANAPAFTSGRNFFTLNGLPTPNSTLAARLDSVRR